MKGKLIGFGLGLMVFMLISSTVVTRELITVKPQTPKSTVIIYHNSIIEVRDKAFSYTRRGYIIKTMAVSKSGNVIIVLEKY